MKEKIKKFSVWLLAIALVMGVYTLSFQREYNQYRTTSYFHGVVQEVISEEVRIIVEDAEVESEQGTNNISIPTEDSSKFQVGDSVKVTFLERLDKRHTGLKDQKVEIEKVE